MADYARGERLRELRDRTHKSQETVAAELGVSTKTVRAWEHGGGIHWENAKRLGSFYGEDPETLVSRELPEVGSNGAQPPTQLDRIAEQISDLHALFFGDEGTGAAGIAARLLRTDESPPPSTGDEPETPPEAQQPPSA